MSGRVGIDLGGTSAKIAVINSKKKVIHETNVMSHGFPTARQLSAEIAQAVKQLLGGKKPLRVGVGVAGDIDFDKGVVRISPNLGWTNVPLRDLLKKEFGCPVTIDNDANAAAWGVFQTQVPKGITDVVVITLGTGVGGGVILNGRVHRGATGSAGEIGHIVLDENGRRCNCGLNGCLETFAGGIHLVQVAKELLSRGQASTLADYFRENPESITPKAIADAAVASDSFARSLWNQMGQKLGVALGNLIYLLNPQMIFLTGGVSQAGDLILKPLHSALEQRPFQTPVRAAQIQIAKEPAHMGVIGAALL